MEKIHISARIKCLITTLFFLLLLVACTSESDEVEGYTYDKDKNLIDDSPVAMVIVMGKHANAMAIPDDAYYYIKESTDHVVYGGYACAIVVDSTPTKIELVEENFFEQNAHNPKKLKEFIEERKGKLIEKLKEVNAADSPEVDLLAAIREAASALSSTRANKIPNKQIVIIDTGICTSGDLSLIGKNLLNGFPDIEEIINQLRAYEGVGVLPDLTGITVIFIGTEDCLAEVASPQSVLVSDKRNIKNLWEAVVRACGADDVQFVSAAGWDTPNVYTEDDESKFPYVSCVAFHHENVIDFPDPVPYTPSNPDSPPDMPEPPSIEIEIPSSEIGFKPNEAIPQQEESFDEKIQSYEKDINKYLDIYPNEKILVVGTSATTKKDGEGSVDLSLRRAEAVKKKLVECGVPEDKLVTIGLGAKFPWAVDAFPNGSFETEIAQKNRAVWLLNISAENEKFNMIKSAYEEGTLLPAARERFLQFISDFNKD